jgi:hypothetical protein
MARHVPGYPRFPRLAALARFSFASAWSLRRTVLEFGAVGPVWATLAGLSLEWSAVMRSVTPDAEEVRLGRRIYACYDEPEAAHA